MIFKFTPNNNEKHCVPNPGAHHQICMHLAHMHNRLANQINASQVVSLQVSMHCVVAFDQQRVDI